MGVGKEGRERGDRELKMDSEDEMVKFVSGRELIVKSGG